jgi:hypothetical protein
MIDMQLIEGALVALAALVGIAIVISVVMLASGSAGRHGPAPHGGTRRSNRSPTPTTTACSSCTDLRHPGGRG